MKAWRVTVEGYKPFTFISDQCDTPEEVKAAITDKMCKKVITAELL